MRHIMGNSPHCNECLHYRKPEPGKKCTKDGWCTNQKHLQIGINGHKREHPSEWEPVIWQECCQWWEDAEYPHINHFEAVTHKPDPNRKGIESMIIADAIAKAEEEQKDLGAYYERKRKQRTEDE